MNKRITWCKPDGSWGVKGVDLTTLPPGAYGALYKLKKMEDMVEQINRPGAPDWLVRDITAELLGQALEPLGVPNGKD